MNDRGDMDALMAAADALAELVAEGECPWRDGTSEYREWYRRRAFAHAEYCAARDALAKAKEDFYGN